MNYSLPARLHQCGTQKITRSMCFATLIQTILLLLLGSARASKSKHCIWRVNVLYSARQISANWD